MDYDAMSRAYTEASRNQPNIKWSGWKTNDYTDYIVVQVKDEYHLSASRNGLGSVSFQSIAVFGNYDDALIVASLLNKNQ